MKSFRFAVISPIAEVNNEMKEGERKREILLRGGGLFCLVYISDPGTRGGEKKK